jgi:hypothetical protein
MDQTHSCHDTPSIRMCLPTLIYHTGEH